MKKIFLILFALISFIFASEAQDYYWEKIDVKMLINKDGIINVEEKQEYVFSGNSFGGSRLIPLTGALQIEDLDLCENGIKYHPGNLSHKYQYQISQQNKLLNIIWRSRDDQDPKYNQTHCQFILKYKIKGAIKFGAAIDKLFWPVIYEGREARVNKASVVLQFPQELDPDQLDVSLLNSASWVSWKYLGSREICFSGQEIYPDQPFIVKISFPSGMIKHRPFSLEWWRRLIESSIMKLW